MPYEIVYEPPASKRLKKLKSNRDAVQSAIDNLANDPRPDGVRKLAGEDELYRIHIDQWRVIYAVSDDEQVVIIAHIRPRNEKTYKNL